MQTNALNRSNFPFKSKGTQCFFLATIQYKYHGLTQVKDQVALTAAHASMNETINRHLKFSVFAEISCIKTDIGLLWFMFFGLEYFSVIFWHLRNQR